MLHLDIAVSNALYTFRCMRSLIMLTDKSGVCAANPLRSITW